MANTRRATSVEEIERKYDADPGGALPDSAELLGGDDVRIEDQLLEAVYYDTPDLMLLREGGDAPTPRAASRSKVGRLLAERRPAGPDGLDPTAGGAVTAYLRVQVERLHRLDQLVRRDRPDAVHQMRVAARRLRSAMQGFGRVLARDASAALCTELRWLAGELAPARDTEVMAARFQEILDTLPDELVLGPVSASVTRAFAVRGATARARVLAALDGDRYLALLGALDTFLAAPPFTARAARPARRELPRCVAACYDRFAERITAARRAPTGPERDAALHETRKAAKRLRYATEVAIPAVGAPAQRLQLRLTGVQNLLGTHQDTAVARPVLRELGVAAHLAGDNGFTYGLLHSLESARAAAAEDALPDAWRRMHGRRTVGWLGRSGG